MEHQQIVLGASFKRGLNRRRRYLFFALYFCVLCNGSLTSSTTFVTDKRINGGRVYLLLLLSSSSVDHVPSWASSGVTLG